ncbi:MAG: ATP-binding protein [Candidatus Binatia bacterium]
MPKRLPASLVEIVLRSAITGWIAALYGALYIWARADFAATGTLWLFSWPFCILLALATLGHLLVAGAGGDRWPSPVGWVRSVNRALGSDAPEQVPADVLTNALVRLPGFPASDAVWSAIFAGSVVLVMGALEWHVAGNTRNVEPILIGGLIATVLYAAMSFTVTEMLVHRPCQRLRLAAAGLGLDPYVGPTLATPVRILTLATPTVLALVVAPPLVTARGLASAGLAHGIIVVLGTGLCVGLAWLHAIAIREAAADLGDAARRLVGSEAARFITGTIDAELVEMARAFNIAASDVDRSLQISAARYSALFEGAGDAILLVEPATGRILEANRRALELTRLGELALKATEIESLFTVETPLENVRRLPAGTYRWRSGMRVQRPDGSECPVDLALSTVAVGDHTVLQAILHDVSERERIEGELRQSVQRLEGLYHLAVTLGGTVEQVAEHIAVTLPALLDVPIVAVGLYDGDDQVMLAVYEGGTVSRGMRYPLRGTPAERVRDERRPCVIADANRRFPSDAFLAGRSVTSYVGIPVLGRDGEVAGQVAVMDERARRPRDQDMRLLSTFAGRLARALHEDEYLQEREDFIARVTNQNTDLRAAQERLTEADRLKNEFMGMMSHELRTPLNIFMGYTELMLDAAHEGDAMPVDEQRDVLGRMLDSARTLTGLVEDTLSVLRLESAGVRVLVQDLPLPALFDELRGAERLLRKPSAVREEWIVEPDVPVIPSDRMKLRQILTNLVGNARKFTREGTIEVRARRIGAEQIAIRVTDTGCGITAADVPHVFELYRQANNGGAHNGCGIGLYIVSRYCELLGGRVEVESEVGRGTCFTVTLPVRADAIANATAA